MLARRHNDAEPRARLDINVWIDTALTNEPELIQSMEQRRSDLGPLAYQHQRFGIPQSFGQRIDILDVIVPDRDLVARQLLEALERAKSVVIIVKNGDLHSGPLSKRRKRSCRYALTPMAGDAVDRCVGVSESRDALEQLSVDHAVHPHHFPGNRLLRPYVRSKLADVMAMAPRERESPRHRQ